MNEDATDIVKCETWYQVMYQNGKIDGERYSSENLTDLKNKISEYNGKEENLTNTAFAVLVMRRNVIDKDGNFKKASNIVMRVEELFLFSIKYLILSST